MFVLCKEKEKQTKKKKNIENLWQNFELSNQCNGINIFKHLGFWYQNTIVLKFCW